MAPIRQIANSKLYHVVIRGVNKQNIFYDKQDVKKYQKEIQETKQKYQYSLLAYAFMDNHVHFVVKDIKNNISTFMQSLRIRYVKYFNTKYERINNLGEFRFKSKPIETEDYLKNVVRYIHKNPEKIGESINSWRTSYLEYIEQKEYLAQIEDVIALFTKDGNYIENFIEFHKNYNVWQDYDKDYELNVRITDQEAVQEILRLIKEDNIMAFQRYTQEDQNYWIKKIGRIEGITKSQIARILGISRKSVHRKINK